VTARRLGGTVGVHVVPATGRGARAIAERDARQALQRIAAWAAHLTRFEPTSDLVRLNVDPRTVVPVRPTLAAVMDWARTAESVTDGIVDVTLLDARLAAQRGRVAPLPPSRSWSYERSARSSTVRRPVGVRFDLDGVAKGWLADRALSLLDGHPSALVDGDGDLALRLAPGTSWLIGVADPREPGLDLLVLTPSADSAGPSRRFGIATSGTSVHRWDRGLIRAHHLIDPRSGRPARTDVIQATVLSTTARHAEAFAKTAVILGSAASLGVLDRPEVLAAALLTDRGDLLVTPGTLRWVA